MKTKIYLLCIATILTIATVFSPIYVLAQEEIEFNGVITAVQGQRLEVEIGVDERIWITTEHQISENDVGVDISGHYMSLGDSNLLISSSLDEQ